MRSKALFRARTGLAAVAVFAIFKARVIPFADAPGLEFFESLVWMNAVFKRRCGGELLRVCDHGAEG